MAEILYSALVGMGSALIIAIIVGVPKLIIHLITKPSKTKDKPDEEE